jgi:hypothetical protein
MLSHFENVHGLYSAMDNIPFILFMCTLRQDMWNALQTEQKLYKISGLYSEVH